MFFLGGCFDFFWGGWSLEGLGWGGARRAPPHLTLPFFGSVIVFVFCFFLLFLVCFLFRSDKKGQHPAISTVFAVVFSFFSLFLLYVLLYFVFFFISFKNLCCFCFLATTPSQKHVLPLSIFCLCFFFSFSFLFFAFLHHFCISHSSFQSQICLAFLSCCSSCSPRFLVFASCFVVLKPPFLSS